jgi:hypothetical protein
MGTREPLPLGIYPYTESDEKRIWGKVRTGGLDECWEWQANISRNGYGKTEIWKNGYAYARTAHRAIYEIQHKVFLPKETFVCHKCDNRKCCNPDHLFLGTASDNMHDCLEKGRHFEASKTHCKYGHEFTPENTRRDKKGWRYCNACWGSEARKEKYNRSKKIKVADTLF